MKISKLLRRVSIGLILSFCLIAGFSNDIVYATESDLGNLGGNSVVEVEGFVIDGGYLEAGKQNTVTLTLQNTNRYTVASNLVVAISSNSGMIYPAYGDDNHFYVGTVRAGDVVTLDIPIMVDSKVNVNYVDFTCDLVYESNGNRIATSSNMVLPTQNISTILVNSINVSDHAKLNGKSLLSISYSNNSNESVNGLTLLINGNVSEETKSIELGSASAGKSYTKDCNIVYTEQGEQVITVKLIYSEVNGSIIESDLGTYKIDVQEADEAEESQEKTRFPYYGGLVLAVLAFCVAVVEAFLYIKKR